MIQVSQVKLDSRPVAIEGALGAFAALFGPMNIITLEHISK